MTGNTIAARFTAFAQMIERAIGAEPSEETEHPERPMKWWHWVLFAVFVPLMVIGYPILATLP